MTSDEDAGWPRRHRKFRRITTTDGGEPAFTVVLAYQGISVLAYWAALAAALLVLVVAIVSMSVGVPDASLVVLIIVFPLVTAAAMFMGRYVAAGALVASARGLEFTPYDQSIRKRKPERAMWVAWENVEVVPGFVTKLMIRDDGQLQLGPRNRRFAETAASYAGRSLGSAP